ncbi:aminotransferase class IV [Singulisphaera sp. GP187]|uniref:aminotransferase class IV n=1 Tax=Singulisphaera sp. GP187 TaxID=1882752 RepID=UPI000940A2C3|nr:aminotransferase class IV [Singulisphaera sp. GP187]
MLDQELTRAGDPSSAGSGLERRLVHDPVGVLRDRGINLPDELPPRIVQELARVVSLLWVDGRVVPLDRFYIDPSDEGLLFGRGAWESTRTVGGAPWLWPLHLDRIRSTAEVLGIQVTPERLPDREQVAAYVRSLTSQDVTVRLNVSAGRSGAPGLVWMSAAPMPYPPSSIRLRTRPSPVSKGQAYLTLKTFQYATRLRIGQQAAQDGFDSALLIDADGNLLEASHANIFIRTSDGWSTPTADGGMLPGTVRHYLLTNSPVPIHEQVIPLARLGEAREAFVTNSNVGIVPVTQIDGYSLSIGEETLGLMRWLQPPTAAAGEYRLRERGTAPR